MILKCDRCHGDFNLSDITWVTHYRKHKKVYLCVSCYRFIRQRFDDVIDEYILRKE